MSRWRVTFWLDDQRADDLAVGAEVVALKQKRQFAQTVKQGIKLIQSLRSGDTSYLKELFPLIVAQIEYEMIKRDDDDSGGDGDDQPSAESILAEMRAEFAATRSAIAEQGKKIIPLFDNDGGLAMAGQKQPAAATTTAFGKTVQFTAAPSEDDDGEDTIVLNKLVSKTSPLDNLLAGMMKADERSEQLYAENLAAGNIDPRSGRRINTVQPGLD